MISLSVLDGASQSPVPQANGAVDRAHRCANPIASQCHVIAQGSERRRAATMRGSQPGSEAMGGDHDPMRRAAPRRSRTPIVGLSDSGNHGSESERESERRSHRNSFNRVTSPSPFCAVGGRMSFSSCQAREETIARVREVGRRHRKKESSNYQQAPVENAYSRWKSSLGDRLRERCVEGTAVEVALGCKILNTMLVLGRPESEVIAHCFRRSCESLSLVLKTATRPGVSQSAVGGCCAAIM
jgi:hypothetical protein